mmetsp:Transcript_30894/g.52856  ORF Transcript_30894/g.52856 Transcript_30894/m.52856 type:complete len:146 (-) Transcript_30894:97-534(-)
MSGNVGSLFYPAQCSSIKKNHHVVIKEHPCKVVETSTSKTGKHGHAKVHMVGIDIFTGKKYEEICPSTHNMNVPNVNRTEYMLLDISDDDFLSLMMPDGSTKEDLKIPEGEIGEKLREAFNNGKEVTVQVLSAMGMEQAKSFKEA